MKTSKFTDEQIALGPRQVEAGSPVTEVCRKLGVSVQTSCRWKKRFGSLGVPELRELHPFGTRIASSKGWHCDVDTSRNRGSSGR